MELSGKVDVYDWVDPITGLTLRIADYDLMLTVKLMALRQAAVGEPSLRQHLDEFNKKVLDQMELNTPREGNEPPLYQWVRSMKVLNRLSFEDGIYNIPDTLAACIVRSKDAAQFVRLLGG